jgi:hypothetical protein
MLIEPRDYAGMKKKRVNFKVVKMKSKKIQHRRATSGDKEKVPQDLGPIINCKVCHTRKEINKTKREREQERKEMRERENAQLKPLTFT